MAATDLRDAAKQWVDPGGKTWDTIAYRRLSHGEYMRLMLERNGVRLMLQHGVAQGAVVAWGWAAPLSLQDAGWLVCDLGSAMVKAAATMQSLTGQAADKIVSLEGRVVTMATELKALKDKES